MASSPCNVHSEPAKIEQIITEFFAKSLHIILESRSPYVSSRNYSGDHFTSSPSSSSSSSSFRPRDKWFNLALRDCPAALENFDLWRQSNLEPLVVDVIVIRRQSAPHLGHPSPGGCLLRNLSSKDRSLDCWTSGQGEFVPETKNDKIIERWIVQYESRKSSETARDSYSGGKRSSAVTSQSSELLTMYKKTYKRSIVLLRSLYVTVRLLPAHKLFRDLNSSGQIHPFSLTHRISSFVEPFTRAEDAEMNQFCFVPVDTPCGRLCLSVSYLRTLEDVSSEPSTPLSTQVIPDYVGSPTTDPLKRFQSLPSAGPAPTDVSFTRRHSWSNDHAAMPSVSPSPSPTYSDSRAFHRNSNPHLPPRSHMHDDNFPSSASTSHNSPLAHKKNMSFDEYWPSPPLSPSPSPSPPTHLPGGHLPNALLRSESAPVSIPLPRPGMNVGVRNQPPIPSPSPKNTRPRCSSQADILRDKVSPACVSQISSFESKPQVKEPLRFGELQTGTSLQKVFSFGKDEIGNIPGLKISSCSSPRIFSRSSSKLSFLDEFDDSEFRCPFAVDDDLITDSQNRFEASDDKGHIGETLDPGGLLPVRKSQEAAVGALVRMLKTAPPLCQDVSNSARFSQASKDECWDQGIQPDKDLEVGVGKLQNAASSSEITASGLFKSKTAADALEELGSYREMKELLLGQGGSRSLDVHPAAKSAAEGSSEV